MPELLSGDSANAVWEASWSRVGPAPTLRDSGSKGSSRELLHALIAIRDPRQRWTTVRRPAMNPAFALAEVVWILRGRRDAAFLTPWNSSLPKYVGETADLHGAYGERLRSRFGFDQLKHAAGALTEKPNQRQVVLQIWDPASDLPMPDGRPRAADIPCNVCAMLKISNGQLYWTQIMRSNDLILGLPYNIVQWTIIQEVVAGWLEVEVGPYSHYSDSLHIYDRDASFGLTQESQGIVLPAADLRLPLDESEATFRELERFLEELITLASADAIASLVRSVVVPLSYNDWVLVLAAEWLRRLNLHPQAVAMAEAVVDRLLAAAVLNWLQRKEARN